MCAHVSVFVPGLCGGWRDEGKNAAHAAALLDPRKAKLSGRGRGPVQPLGFQIEDERENRRAICGLPEKPGCRPACFEKAETAIASLRETAYDCVLMDIHLPGMDGLQATGTIRALDSAKRDIPIVAMTASAMKGGRERCLDAGMVDYLPKPVLIQDLAGVLERTVRGS